MVQNYNETQEFDVNPDSELVFHLKNDSYYYFIESNVENIISTYTDNQGLDNSTSLTILEYERTSVFDYEVNINYFFLECNSLTSIKFSREYKFDKFGEHNVEYLLYDKSKYYHLFLH